MLDGEVVKITETTKVIVGLSHELFLHKFGWNVLKPVVPWTNIKHPNNIGHDYIRLQA